MREPLTRWLIAACALAMAGCASLPPDVRREMAPGAPGERNPFEARGTLPPAPARAAPERGAPAPGAERLASGQLLVWSHPGAAGLFVNLFAETFSPWTHIGVVSVEPDGVFVYDSNAELRVSADGPASVSGAGGLQRIPYARFLDSDRVYGLYDPPPEVDAQALVRFVQDHHRRRTPFDPRYDSTDPRALYCSELVALGFEAAGAGLPGLVPVRRHRSYDRLRAWLDLSSQGFHLPGQMVERGRAVAVWARGRNRAQIEALFAARAELARRFDAQTRLGLLMRWNDVALGLASALALRDTPERFIQASEAALAGVPDEAVDPAAVRREVGRLADAMLGAVTTP